MANISNYYTDKLVFGTSGDDSIYNAGQRVTLDAGDGRDIIENRVPKVTIESGDGDDSISNDGEDVYINGGDDNDSIANGGANASIVGGDGNDTIRHYSSNASIVGGAGDDLISLASYSQNNLITYAAGEGNDSIIGFTEDDTFSIAGGYSTTKSGSDVIITVGDGKITLVGAASLSTLNIDGEEVTTGGGDSKLITLTEDDDDYSNSVDGVTIMALGGNDCINNNGGANVLFTYAEGDGNDFIVGFNETSTLSISGGTYSTTKSGKDVIITVGDGKITLRGAVSLSALNIDGEEYSSDTLTLTNDDTAKITLASGVEFADASSRTAAIRIVGNALDNSILGGTGKDTLYGKNGDDYLAGGNGSDKLYGQSGDDTLYGGSGNDTLSGGLGEDLFIYSAGNDVITDYEVGEKISLGADVSNASLNGNDAVLIVGKYKLTVKNAKYKELTLIDASGNETTKRVGATIYDNTSAAKVTLASDVEFADASSRTKATRIVGNALDNSILGGTGKDTLYGGDGNDFIQGGKGNDKLYGQAGDDTLWGGLGNDTLNGGDGADKFIYESGDGKDVISGFDKNDMLLITGAFTASYDKTADTIAFKVGSGSITLKDFTATTFNVNGYNYRVKGNKLVK